jgi:integrase
MGVKVRQKIKGKGKPWWVFVTQNGKRKSKLVGDKKAAQKVASEIREKLAKGDLNLEDQRKVPAFGEYSKKWVEGYIKGVRRLSTFERYQELLENHILPVFKNKPLDKITRGDIRDFLIGKIGQNYSRSTICVFRDVISGVFNYAIDEEVIKVNPVSGITKRLELNRSTKPGIEPLTKEEVSLFLDTCEAHYPEFHPFFLMAARTGLRLGELLAVRWGDIDFNSRFVWVRQSYRRGQFTPPKNGKDRKVDMSDQLAATLRKLLTQRKKEALKKGLGEVDELVFHRSSGAPIEQNYIRRVFKRVLKKAELREIRPHDLRHTFASLLLTQGESPVYVKEQLGHSSIQITVDIYGHLIPGANRGAVNKLDDAPSCTPSAPTNKKGGITASIH